MNEMNNHLIELVIKSFKNCPQRIPGSNGFPGEFHQIFQEELTKHFINTSKNIVKNEHFPTHPRKLVLLP